MEITLPTADEFPSGVQPYISRVTEPDLLTVLKNQPAEFHRLLGGLPLEKETFRYAPDKWTIRQVLGHVIDAERVYGYRAMCIARGESQQLPGFEENEYARQSGHDYCTLSELLREFQLLRESHVLMFTHFPAEALNRTGTANKSLISVRAISAVMAGHAAHHLATLTDRYGLTTN